MFWEKTDAIIRSETKSEVSIHENKTNAVITFDGSQQPLIRKKEVLGKSVAGQSAAVLAFIFIPDPRHPVVSHFLLCAYGRYPDRVQAVYRCADDP